MAFQPCRLTVNSQWWFAHKAKSEGSSRIIQGENIQQQNWGFLKALETPRNGWCITSLTSLLTSFFAIIQLIHLFTLFAVLHELLRHWPSSTSLNTIIDAILEHDQSTADLRAHDRRWVFAAPLSRKVRERFPLCSGRRWHRQFDGVAGAVLRFAGNDQQSNM